MNAIYGENYEESVKYFKEMKREDPTSLDELISTIGIEWTEKRVNAWRKMLFTELV